MNPIEQLLKALSMVGQGTPESAAATNREMGADAQLNQQGSVMGSKRQGELTGGQDPLLATLSKLINAANPIDWMGGMAGGPAAQAVAGGRFFHGTPKVFDKFDPLLSKSSGLVGPGHAYLTSSPKVAGGSGLPHAPGGYAAGATHMESSAPTIEQAMSAGMQPNIRPYQVKPHNSLVTDKPFPQQDMDMLLNAIRQNLGTPQPGSFQKGNQANRATNVANSVRSQSGGSGQQVYDQLLNTLGPDRANQVVKQAGFQSIQYPGGNLMGDEAHQAMNVLDPSIMQNLFEALAGSTPK